MERLVPAFGDRDECTGRARDCVSADAAVDAGDTERNGLVRSREHPSERFDGIRAPGGDVVARVPAQAAGELDEHDEAVGIHGLGGQRHAEEGVVAPGAADRELFVARPVEIDEQAPGDERAVEGVRTVEPLLLGHREQELERAVLDRAVFGDGERGSDAETVVGSERRPVRAHPVVLDAHVDPSLTGIERAVRVALADHVEMGLEDDAGGALATRRRGNAHDDVALGVGIGLV